MPYEIAPTTSFTDEEHAQELLNELLEDGHDEDDMKGFIEIFGSKAFYQNYEDYLRICLLYTSPSPRDRQKSRMPSSA